MAAAKVADSGWKTEKLVNYDLYDKSHFEEPTAKSNEVFEWVPYDKVIPAIKTVSQETFPRALPNDDSGLE